MSGNKLIFWLSHLGEGTWEAFRKAVHQATKSPDGEEDAVSALAKGLRFRLSELGFVDFLPEKRYRWKMQPPVLASFTENPERAILCGGRSPDLVARLRSVAESSGCVIQNDEQANLPDHIIVAGENGTLDSLAAALPIRRSEDFAEELIEQFVTIESMLRSAQPGELMIGWRHRYFDLRVCQWTENELPHTVCECTSRYGRTITFLQVSRKKLLVLPRREAIYAAAMLSGNSIASYQFETQTLSAPLHAPLPENQARLACLSSGTIGLLCNGSVCYRPVPPRIARTILASLGQSTS